MVTKIVPPLPIFLELEGDWPVQGEWTYEDYLRLPDDGRRYEIIRGVLYVVNAPSYDHQYTVSELHLQLGNFVKQKNLGIVLVAPFEIHLPGIARPVLPDVFFITAQRQPSPGASFFTGAPDLIVEVLSPSTARLDRVVKFGAYEQAGVQEYWLADPRTRFVEVYALSTEGGEYTLLGQFGPEEQLRSEVLPDLQIAVAMLFIPSGEASKTL